MASAHNQKATDAEVVAAYEKTHSVWAAGKLLGLCGQSVQERLARLGVIRTGGKVPLTDEEVARLRKDYLLYRDHGRLDELAKEMGRHKTTLVAAARKLRLIQRNGKGKRRIDQSVWKYLDEKQATIIWDDFKASRMGMIHYCRKLGYDDLGFSKKMKQFFADEWDHVMESKAPRQGLYRVGRQLEYRTRDFLERHGYFVLRSPASKSPVDLVAIRPGSVLFVQSKKTGSLPPKEWNALYDLAISTGCVPLMSTGHPSGRGVVFNRLVGRKLEDGSKARQPWKPYSLDDVTEGTLFAEK